MSALAQVPLDRVRRPAPKSPIEFEPTQSKWMPFPEELLKVIPKVMAGNIQLPILLHIAWMQWGQRTKTSDPFNPWSDPLSFVDLSQKIGCAVSNVKCALDDALERGLIERAETVGPKHKYRYRLCPWNWEQAEKYSPKPTTPKKPPASETEKIKDGQRIAYLPGTKAKPVPLEVACERVKCQNDSTAAELSWETKAGVVIVSCKDIGEEAAKNRYVGRTVSESSLGEGTANRHSAGRMTPEVSTENKELNKQSSSLHLTPPSDPDSPQLLNIRALLNSLLRPIMGPADPELCIKILQVRGAATDEDIRNKILTRLPSLKRITPGLVILMVKEVAAAAAAAELASPEVTTPAEEMPVEQRIEIALDLAEWTGHVQHAQFVAQLAELERDHPDDVRRIREARKP